MSSIRDIAQAAGVSISTVSKALNNHGHISAATRQRIGEVAERLNYSPNSFARALASKVSDNIGFVIDRAPDQIFSNPFYSVILEGIESELVKHGFNLLISAHASTEAALPNFVRTGTVAGLIMAGSVAPPLLQRLRENNLPVVVVDNQLEDKSFDTINSDNFQGAQEMMNYLIGLGHRELGFLFGANRHPNMAARHRAFRQTMRRQHLPIKSEWLARGDVTKDGGYEAMQRFVQRGKKLPTAIFASNDVMALGAIKLLHERGLRVPQQISVVGFDNILLAEHSTPSLTTVDVDKIRMGQLAAQRLIEKLKSADHTGREIIVPTNLIIRESSSRPAAPTARRVKV